ncbi:helix-turn-helix transcriptional regulator [Crocinitomix catalasitica]|nr:helix-turn-helix transcriptional regulator [Crocinitomix catalasitica]
MVKPLAVMQENARMTFYEKELNRINGIIYSNQEQIEIVIGVKSYIDNNFDNDLNLDLLSHFRFVSKYRLLRLFKRHYGLTPRQYLIDKRIENSKEHLKNGMSVTETCFAVGFESLGSFSTLFKTKTGKSPSEFQKEQLSRSILNSEY